MCAMDEFSDILDRKTTLRLSLVISLMDEFTAKQPIGDIRVFIKDRDIKSIKNRSGYYFFLNLPDGQYKVCVESEYYKEVTEELILPLFEPQNPLEIILKSKPSYPFPHRATLIRGMVQDSNGNSVAGANLEVIGKDINNESTDNGEFVLYFKALTEEEIIIRDSKRYVKGDSDGTVNLRATHGNKIGTIALTDVEENKSTILESKIILS